MDNTTSIQLLNKDTYELDELSAVQTVAYLEQKRFLEALDEAGETLTEIQAAEDGADTTFLAQLATMIYTTKLNVSSFWTRYISDMADGLLVPYEVNDQHQIADHQQNQSPISKYLYSMRRLLNKSQKSYIGQTLMTLFGLDKPREIGAEFSYATMHILTQSEAVIDWYMHYLAYLEHGAQLALDYIHVANEEFADLFEDEDDDSLDPDLSELYDDNRVKAYALLKTTDIKPERTLLFLEKLNELIDAIMELTDYRKAAYSVLEDRDLQKLLNFLTNKKAISKENEEYQNVLELMQFVQSIFEEDLEAPFGISYNKEVLLRSAGEMYISKLTDSYMNSLAFLPTRESQKKFIRQFEQGSLWQSATEQ